MMALALAAAAAAATVTIPGPKGPLEGTLLTAGAGAPVVVVIPGSGPTDRDGNSPLGITAAPYRLLAEALAGRGVSTLRIDKRGLFGSKAAGDPNDVTVAAYAADTRGWAKEAARLTGRSCVWLLGHSEGGLVALQAAQDRQGLCGVILVAAPGRPLGEVMRDQLRANPANAPILAPALAAIDSLEAGRRIDAAALPPPLPMLFPAAVQGYMIDLFAQDPQRLAASLKVPLLIVQGDRDLQVGVADARRLAAGAPAARLAILPGVNHVMKRVTGNDAAADIALYRDASVPVDAALVTVIASMVTGPAGK